MPQMSKSQILSDTIYHTEYYSAHAGGSAHHPTFSTAYLVYSTSKLPIIWNCVRNQLIDVWCFPAIGIVQTNDFGGCLLVGIARTIGFGDCL